jgi:hypothetical protein
MRPQKQPRETPFDSVELRQILRYGDCYWSENFNSLCEEYGLSYVDVNFLLNSDPEITSVRDGGQPAPSTISQSAQYYEICGFVDDRRVRLVVVVSPSMREGRAGLLFVDCCASASHVTDQLVQE